MILLEPYMDKVSNFIYFLKSKPSKSTNITFLLAKWSMIQSWINMSAKLTNHKSKSSKNYLDLATGSEVASNLKNIPQTTNQGFKHEI